MTTSHVKGLFKIEDDLLADELVQSLQDPQLRSDFLESGYFLKIFNLDMPSNVKADFIRDLLGSKELRDALRENEGLVRGWEVMLKSSDEGVKALRIEVSSLRKFDEIIRNNNLGLDGDGLKNILEAAINKGQKWDFPENILDAVRRASDANIPGLSVGHKKFPELVDGSGGGYLVPAKLYQKAASGDANLSFEVGGRSFDDVASDGKLIDRKFGYSNSIFDRVENEFGEVDLVIHNLPRVKSLLTQAKGQLDAANGHPIRWEISTYTGTDGIQSIFNGEFPLLLEDFQGVDFRVIEVVYRSF